MLPPADGNERSWTRYGSRVIAVAIHKVFTRPPRVPFNLEGIQADVRRYGIAIDSARVEETFLGTLFTGKFDLNPPLLTTWRYFRSSIAVTFATLAVQLLYHFGPNVKQRFRDSLIGAIVAVVTWVGLSYLLGVYFRHFESLNKTYGPLGAAIGLYLWFYLSGFAILFGGEINFLRGELRSRRLLRSSTVARSESMAWTPRRKSRGTKPFA